MVMIKEIVGLVAVGLVILAYVPYIRNIILKRISPHPFSWFVWSITAMSIFFIQTANGSGAGAYTTATVAVFAFLVFLFARRNRKVKPQLVDIICLIVACIGIVIWLFIQQPVISIVVLLAVELIGFIPTFRQGWEKPHSESIGLWMTNAIRHCTGILAISSYNFITLLNPIVWAIIGIGFTITLLSRRKAKNRLFWEQRRFKPYN